MKKISEKIDDVFSKRHPFDTPFVQVKGRAVKVHGSISFEEIKQMAKVIEQHDRFEKCLKVISSWFGSEKK